MQRVFLFYANSYYRSQKKKHQALFSFIRLKGNLGMLMFIYYWIKNIFKHSLTAQYSWSLPWYPCPRPPGSLITLLSTKAASRPPRTTRGLDECSIFTFYAVLFTFFFLDIQIPLCYNSLRSDVKLWVTCLILKNWMWGLEKKTLVTVKDF